MARSVAPTYRWWLPVISVGHWTIAACWGIDLQMFSCSVRRCWWPCSLVWYLKKGFLLITSKTIENRPITQDNNKVTQVSPCLILSPQYRESTAHCYPVALATGWACNMFLFFSYGLPWFLWANLRATFNTVLSLKHQSQSHSSSTTI